MRPVLRWFGGKYLLADWIIEHFPEHRIYVEPYGGAASVLMRKKKCYAEIYNDLDSDVVNLFRVLRDPDKAISLKRLLELTPFAREEFVTAHEPSVDDIEDARKIIVRSFMGFGADSVSNRAKATGFRASSSRSGTTPAHDWANYPDSIPLFLERLRDVTIENKDAIEVMAQHDTIETLHFVDPPYVHATRAGSKHGYKFEMTNADHLKLLEFLKTLKGMVVLCGYESSLYSELNWSFIERKAYADGAQERTERLWFNPQCLENDAQLRMI